MTLHILLDPSGAYLCLEYSLVCSHLESLVERIRNAAGKPSRVNDPRTWQAFHSGELEQTLERTIGGQQVEIEVRKTEQWLIMGRAA